MDALAQLALMAKAKRVFESPETFLSFPALSPLSYLPDELRFGNAGEMTSDDLSEASEFSRTANQIPRSIIAPVDEGEYLWEVYRDILRTAHVARSVAGEAELAIYQSALGLLYTTTADGLRTDSDRLRTYKQHRDAVFAAEEDLKVRQGTAEASSDPEVTARWKNEEEPRLRQALAELQAAWVSEGLKTEIEAAIQIEQAHAARASSTVWNEWQTAFLDDVDLLTDPSNTRFAITGYSPYDLFDADDWPRFTLSREEMDKLAGDAPAELREIFASGSPTSEIESVSFEYRSVKVTRPWFEPAVFKARFWRLPDGSEPISTGPDDAGGRCPAYIAALVFARNVTVTYRERSGGSTETGGRQFLRLDAAMINPQLTQLVLSAKAAEANPRVRVRDHRTRATEGAAGGVTVTVSDTARAGRRLRAMGFGESPMIAAIAPSLRAGIVRDHRSSGAVRDHRSGGAVRDHRSGGAVRDHRRGGTLVARPIREAILATSVVGTFEPAPEPQPEPAPEPAPDRTGEVMILAYICKRVPPTPNPDPSLAWGT